MSDDNLTLLQQAQAQARQSTLSAGATMDGQSGEAHLAVSKTWRTWSAIVYAKTMFSKSAKPTTAAGFEIKKQL